jgi:retron-type reverse transcriptase
VGKGTHKAINRFRDYARNVSKNNTKTCYVLKCDIRKFFANIDHRILKEILEKHILDKNTLWFLGQVINSFSSQKHIYAMAEMCNKGLPLGNLTSQLLVNIYMNEFDQFVKRELKVKYYIRYADDFVIFGEDKNELLLILRYIVVFLKEQLKLKLHPDKVYIKTFASGVDFLGWINFPHHRVLRTTTKNRMLKNLSKNSKEKSRQSYLGMLSHGDSYKLTLQIKDL